MLEGVAIGLACTAVVGVLTFWLHHKLPYRRMLILTGAMVAVVLMVMIGGTALSFMDLGWIPRTPTPFSVPTWMGTWFEIYPYWETIGAQLLAGTLVVGSYVLAEHVKVRRRLQPWRAAGDARRGPSPRRPGRVRIAPAWRHRLRRGMSPGVSRTRQRRRSKPRKRRCCCVNVSKVYGEGELAVHALGQIELADSNRRAGRDARPERVWEDHAAQRDRWDRAGQQRADRGRGRRCLGP